MSSRQRGRSGARRLSAIGVTLALLASTQGAEARHHGFFHRRFVAHAGHVRHVSLVDSPGFSAMVVDAATGRTLYANHEDELRHPASITKVMTLYLLFEKLEQGEMRLDTRIGVSAHAAGMAPTKLGLRAGSTIAVEDAIKAIVTKSANDMAVAVAESIGGDESSFAALMTRKAHALGMSRTIYVNASGLPDDRQLTTARDLTILGRSIRERFPSYYHYFSTPSFTYAGSFMPNHNHLMSRVTGMDGIKTGYTRASGFNLLSSVNRNGRHIISVVMGGHTAAGRDNIMAGLIEDHIEEAAPTRLADVAPPSPVEEPAPTVQTASAVDQSDEADEDRGPSLIAPTLAVPPAPVMRPFDHARTPNPTHLSSTGSPAAERPRPAFIAGAPKLDPARMPSPMTAAERHRLAMDGSTNASPVKSSSTAVALATATPSTLRSSARAAIQMASAAPIPLARPGAPSSHAPAEETRVDRGETRESTGRERASPAGHGGWIIQIGATDAADKATSLLNRAKSEGRSALASARPFTEKVKKGDATLYRARFAGLDTGEAEEACKTLKRSGFACFAAKD